MFCYFRIPFRDAAKVTVVVVVYVISSLVMLVSRHNVDNCLCYFLSCDACK